MTAGLQIRDLTVRTGNTGDLILDGVSLDVEPGTVVAVVGETGSGKSMTAQALMRMVPGDLEMTARSYRLGDLDMLAADDRALNDVRGGRIAMLHQQPKRMLDPTATVGSHVAEPLRRHLGMTRSQARRRVVELLSEVGIPEPRRRAGQHPHQLSGGMAQRVMIAMALAGGPDVLIADEPTTALDVTVEAQILQLIAGEQSRTGMAMVLISHDVGVVASIADRVAVMYAGRIVEQGPTADVLGRPHHPYTRDLLRCSTLQTDATGLLHTITGSAASARGIRNGCRFRPRCSLAAGDPDLHHRCERREPALGLSDERSARCWSVERTGPAVSV